MGYILCPILYGLSSIKTTLRALEVAISC